MKTTLSMLLLLAVTSAYGQFTKGDKFLSAYVAVNGTNANSENDDKYRNKTFQISPAVGVFLNERYAFGGGLGYAINDVENIFLSGDKQLIKSRSFSIHTFVKRYFLISEKFYFSMEGRVGYQRGNETREYQNIEQKYKWHAVSANISPSLIFFPSPTWGIEASIGSLNFSRQVNLSSEQNSTTVNFNHGTFSLGFAYYFRKSIE